MQLYDLSLLKGWPMYDNYCNWMGSIVRLDSHTFSQ